MFTLNTALVITSLFVIVIVFQFSTLIIEKVIELFKKIKDF
jgi:hypothetical protein